MQTKPDTSDIDVAQVAAALLKRPVASAERAGGGGNSRIYRVEADGGPYALKMYPLLENDPRDRLGVEKKTLQFFERHGLGNVPRWLGDTPGYALLSWAEGPLANPPLDGEIEQAADFLSEVKRLSRMSDAFALPSASEACTSGAEIVRQIDRRLKRLQEAAKEEPALEQFLSLSFLPTLGRTQAAAEAEYGQRGLAFARPLEQGLCLIPADFGFHNAIRSTSGALIFIDFEYFGWDDPVKLTADFLLHPAMPLEPAQRARFAVRMNEIMADDPHFSLRLKALTPLFALRWALILLNEFLPERWSGRAFARGDSEWAAAKERQLGKAFAMLRNATSEESHA